MNILITGAWQDAQENIKKIEEMGHKTAFLQYEKDELPCTSEWVEGVICNGLFLYHPIEQFTNLKYIQLTSAGYDRVPMEYIQANHIMIHNARGVYSVPMAEFAVSGVLQLYKHSSFFFENQKKKKWLKNRELKELYGQTVCIAGCGSVGIECAKRFKAFGCRVIGIDKYVQKNGFFDELYSIDNLKSVLPETDILILTLPLTNETRYLMNADTFAFMKNQSVFVNIARGALADSAALIHVLDSKLYGAVLDVFEEEPLDENNPLWSYGNVIITPHNSFVGNGNSQRLNEVIIKSLKEFC